METVFAKALTAEALEIDQGHHVLGDLLCELFIVELLVVGEHRARGKLLEYYAVEVWRIVGQWPYHRMTNVVNK